MQKFESIFLYRRIWLVCSLEWSKKLHNRYFEPAIKLAKENFKINGLEVGNGMKI